MNVAFASAVAFFLVNVSTFSTQRGDDKPLPKEEKANYECSVSAMKNTKDTVCGGPATHKLNYRRVTYAHAYKQFSTVDAPRWAKDNDYTLGSDFACSKK